MKVNNNFSEQEATVVASINAGVSELTQFATEPLTAFRDFPTFTKQVEGKKENWMEEFKFTTQFIYHKLGEPDEKSLEHQMKGNKVRLVKGRIDRGMAFVQFPIDYICAMVLSKVHDSISGKLEGVSFTYASNDLNFKARWAYGKNKFIVINDIS